MPGEPPGLAPSTLRQAMAEFATGVTVVTTGGSRIHGMTANAFTSVSLEPPTVLCCVSRHAEMHEVVLEARHFGVSVMSFGQENLARYFADKQRPLGAVQFRDVEWWAGERTGAPLLAGALAWLECMLAGAHVVGDHSIFIGEVVSSGRGSPSDGLMFFAGTFMRAARPVSSGTAEPVVPVSMR